MEVSIGGQMTLAAVIQAVVSVIGFLTIMIQLRLLRKNLQGATQDRLYAHYTEICKLFMGKPHLRPYFYDQVPLLDSDKPELKAEVEFMSEAIWGLVEHAFVQKKNVPSYAWKKCWKLYFIERFNKSIVFRNYFEQNSEWYVEELSEVVKTLKPEKGENDGRSKPTLTLAHSRADTASLWEPAE